MYIRPGEVDTYFCETAITKAIDVDVNGAKLVIKGTKARYVKEATDGADKYTVVGMTETIGPPQAVQGNAAVDEPMGIRKTGVTRGILKEGEVVIDGDILGAAAGGELKALTFSATPTAEELKLIICQAEEDMDATNERKGIDVELLLKG